VTLLLPWMISTALLKLREELIQVVFSDQRLR